jgi:sec-independent protein translocase protein TatC
MLFAPRNHEYPDDIFADSRMSFGDHIEVLRHHLIRALQGFLVVLVGGLILDYVGHEMGNESVGLGRPMLQVVVEPVESQVRAFYARRNEKALQ